MQNLQGEKVNQKVKALIFFLSRYTYMNLCHYRGAQKGDPINSVAYTIKRLLGRYIKM